MTVIVKMVRLPNGAIIRAQQPMAMQVEQVFNLARSTRKD